MMSTDDNEELFMIGRRLREERELKKLSRANVAARIGTTERTLIKYEAEQTSIRANELLLLHGMQFDVFYILTGQRQAPFAAEARADYEAGQLGQHIDGLKLGAADAALLRQLADRLAAARPDSAGTPADHGMLTWHDIDLDDDESADSDKLASGK